MHTERAGKRHSFVASLGRKFPFDGSEEGERRAVNAAEEFENHETFRDNPGFRIGEMS